MIFFLGSRYFSIYFFCPFCAYFACHLIGTFFSVIFFSFLVFFFPYVYTDRCDQDTRMPEVRISRSPRRSSARSHWRSAKHPPDTQAPGVLRGSLILILIYVLRGSPIPGRQAPPTSAHLPCYPIGDNESPAQSRSPLPLAGVTRSGL